MQNILFFVPFSWSVVLVNIGGNLLGFFMIQLLLNYAQPSREWQASTLVDPWTSAALLAFLDTICLAGAACTGGPCGQGNCCG